VYIFYEGEKYTKVFSAETCSKETTLINGRAWDVNTKVDHKEIDRDDMK
jgi:hypothetical protein